MPSLAASRVPVGGERADLGATLPGRVEIKGRVGFDATRKFIRQIADTSRSRAVTVATCGPDPAASDREKNDAAALALAAWVALLDLGSLSAELTSSAMALCFLEARAVFCWSGTRALTG
jgi:hypothetical protein